MTRRRRLFTPNKKGKTAVKTETSKNGDTPEDVNSARGRFKGALKDILEPAPSEESDDQADESPVKRERRQSDGEVYLSDGEARRELHKAIYKQSYVLKLFDRSVDLSQFQDDSPLYPICRAWMANQPKADYKANTQKAECPEEGGVLLPGPEGPPVDKAPPLLPEQTAAHKDNINLDYSEVPPPGRAELVRQHQARWAAVRHAWHKQIRLKEARYEKTQEVLNRINVEYPSR